MAQRRTESDGTSGDAATGGPRRATGDPRPGWAELENAPLHTHRGRTALAAGLLASVAVHALVWTLGSELRFPVPDALRAESRLVVLPPAEEPPPPVVEVPAAPEPIARPAEPVASESASEPETPSPPPFIPHDVRPKLLNASFIREYLEAFYPPFLRSTGLEAQVRLWLFVNRQGDVERVRVQSTSGLPEFDDLAVEAASVMDFRPALSGDMAVGVWVEQWIRFQVTPPEDEPLAADTPQRR